VEIKKMINGISVMFFPEGTRCKDGNLTDFKSRAFKMALDLGPGFPGANTF
jgi:1-acyl-sn-glycerol-3-phosphate acyltransferase